MNLNTYYNKQKENREFIENKEFKDNGEFKENIEFKETDHLKETNHHEEIGQERKENASSREKFLNFFKNVTVEPCSMTFIIGSLVSLLSSQNLTLEKACRVNLNYSDEICTSLRLQTIQAQTDYEKEAQKLMASATAMKTSITATVPVIMSLLIGSWSDKTGHRKIFIIIPAFGQLLLCILNMINAYFLNELRLEYLVLSEAIVESLTGGWCIVTLAVNSVLCSITNPETRTFRLGILNFCMTAGFPIGVLIGGATLKNFGYFGCYSTAAALHIINLLYTFFVLKDPERSKEQKQHDNKGTRHFLSTFFDFTNAKESLQVVFKNAPNHRRVRICTLLLVECLLFGPMYGEMAILYIYTRYRYSWDEVDISLFQSYNFILHTIGTLFSVIVLSKMWKWHDSVLGLISTLSKISSSFVYCFAPTGKILYLAPIMDILNGTGLLAVKSTVTKLVETDELGKISSLFGVMQNLMPLLYVSLYTKVYTSTMDVFPGAFFLMGSAMTLPTLFIFSYYWFENKRIERRLKQAEQTEVLS